MQANIPLDGLSETDLLSDWEWLVPVPCRLIALNNFGDMFLESGTGGIHMLNLTQGQIARLADSKEHFQQLITQKENRLKWFMTDLLSEIERIGLSISKGQCFGFKVPPVLGGKVEITNIEVTPLAVYCSLMGQIHQQVNALPKGTKIKEITIG